eukprot:5715850-Ditylum_brightwellii.AAC.1
MSKILAEFMDLHQDIMSANEKFSRANQQTKDEFFEIKDFMLKMHSAETNHVVAWAYKMKEVKEMVKRTFSKVAFIQDKMDKEYRDTCRHLNALQKEFI